VEKGPAAITPLGQVIAGHEVLGREHWHLLSVLQLQPGLDDLSERHSVAGSTRALIAERVGEVEAIKVPEIVRLWNKRIWDFISRLVFLGPALSLLKSLFEVFTALLAKIFGLVVSGLIEVDLRISLSQSL
jgi:hypothetical protein